ncbi:Cysteine--tRNA ligase [subsurface metagenome]
MLQVYNSLTFQKEEFKSISPNEVLMYVCGPTVYDSPHLGHAKSAVVFDIIRRYLEFKGFNVKLVKNVTDIDDKIIKRANEKGIDTKKLSEQYIKEYMEIMDVLNIEKDYKNPKATETIDFMIKFIQGLLEKGVAYEKNGSIYFSVNSFPKYKTIFQNLDTEEEIEQEIEEDQDVAYGEDKLDPRDFALWKKMKEGEPYWESPWSKGRPGWHIECSAMAINYLGETIDIHGGGQDLKFPHHRNEIAQSESFTGKPFANYFLHNGFVNIDDEKMSKSLGNFFLVSEVVKKFDPMVVRFFLISSHYRKSINYSLENMKQIEKNYEKLLNTIKKINQIPLIKESSSEVDNLLLKINHAESNIIEAMDDDFNTPIAIAELLSLIRELNREILEKNLKITQEIKDKFFEFIAKIDKIFGIFPNLEQKISEYGIDSMDEKDKLIKALLNIIAETRVKLREKKIFDISDDIREKLKELGINIEDIKEGYLL